jgi:ribosome-associated protein
MPKQQKDLTAEQLANFCSEIADDRKAENIVVMKLGNASLIADYFVVCTGNSTPHINAVAEWIRRRAREKYNIRPRKIDGNATSQWIIIDFNTVIVHVMSSETRSKYQLEDLWGDAEKLKKAFSEHREL